MCFVIDGFKRLILLVLLFVDTIGVLVIREAPPRVYHNVPRIEWNPCTLNPQELREREENTPKGIKEGTGGERTGRKVCERVEEWVA